MKPAHFTVLALAILLSFPVMAAKRPKTSKQQNSLEQYVQQVSVPQPVASQTSPGSLYITGGLLSDPYSDVRAHSIGDSIAIRIAESTTISQSGSLTSKRSFSHSSAVTGVGGQTPSFLNPLLAANSATNLTGSGQAASSSSLNTTLTGQIVSALPNGSFVIEARRQVLANNQHESVVLRGVIRPVDIATDNSIRSSQIMNLQLEVKGKGVISDSARQPNIVMRTLLRFIGF